MTNSMPLGDWAVEWFERRGIGGETVARCGIYTARALEGGAVEPDAEGRVIVFPTTEGGKVVNEKYRGANKKFWQSKGGRRTFWNADVLDDPALAEDGPASDRNVNALIITEGEIDALVAIDNGLPLTVSVPDGAPPVAPGDDPDTLAELDPKQESGGKFEFLWNNRMRLRKVRRIILAVDNDPPGRRLAAEIVRRLGAVRCLFVTYPEGSKDLNDVLCHHGREEVLRVIKGAQPYPVHGLYRLSDYPDVPPLTTLKTRWFTLNEHFRPFLGGLICVGGIPGHGKSAIVENLMVDFCETYGIKAAVFSPEQPVVPHMRDRLRRMRLRMPPENASRAMINAADDWIDEHILFIAGDPTGEHDEEQYLEWVLERASDAVMRDGIRILAIDPWNEVEQLRRRGESQPEYIGRGLRMVNQFRRRYDVMTFLNVHPTKEVGKDGKSRAPTPYDTDGSAHFFNKADHFLIVHREDEDNNNAMVRVAKVKFTGTGRKGIVTLKFNPDSHRYDTLRPDDPIPTTLDGLPLG